MSNEYVLDQLALCEEKLLKLMDDFGDTDLEKIQKQMEEEEVWFIYFTLTKILKNICFSK